MLVGEVEGPAFAPFGESVFFVGFSGLVVPEVVECAQAGVCEEGIEGGFDVELAGLGGVWVLVLGVCVVHVWV